MLSGAPHRARPSLSGPGQMTQRVVRVGLLAAVTAHTDRAARGVERVAVHAADLLIDLGGTPIPAQRLGAGPVECQAPSAAESGWS